MKDNVLSNFSLINGVGNTEKEQENPLTKALKETSSEEPYKEPLQTGEALAKVKEKSKEEAKEESKEKVIRDTLDEAKEETKKGPKELLKKYKKLLMGVNVLLFIFLVIYLGMPIYFRNHFYFGTKINGINVSGKTLEAAKETITAELKAYTLTIKGRGGKLEQIKANAVGLKYPSDAELKKIKDSQEGSRWIAALFNAYSLKKQVVFTYDKKQLREQINQLNFFKPENIIEPKNATFKYEDKSYVIVKEVSGNKVNKEILSTHVADYIRNGEAAMDLEASGCYVLPQFDAKSPKVIETKNTLNKYVASKIIYTFGNTEKTLDGSLINQWLTYDQNYKVTVNEVKVKAYVKELANTYNTVGKTRNFLTSSGKTIKISGGDYGRVIDKVSEKQYIISAIKAGKIITREPVFKQNAFSQEINDIGNTYVEISIAKQHLWFYKNGALIVHGAVVTGNINLNRSTHKGIYSLKYIAKNVVLRGQDYAAPVTFWMPFDGGIGIHDASWRSAFGGNIYKFNGSHGCVNSPYNLAKKIYYNITPGTPIIVY